MNLRLKIYRYDPEKDDQPYFQTYEIQLDPMDRLLDCLNRIRWEQDPTLSYRWSCAHGVCGSDGMRINGVCGLACQKLAKDLGEEVLIEPLPGFKVIKDLIVDLSPFFEKYQSVKPYLMASSIPSNRESLQCPGKHQLIEESIRCILCACCTASCPIYQIQKDYVGPAALVRAYRYLFDSRDRGTRERIELLDHKSMAWGCQTLWKCTEVCPKEIQVTQKIGQIKKRIYEAKHPQEKI